MHIHGLNIPYSWLLPLAFVAYLCFRLYLYAPLKVKDSQIKDVDAGFQPIDVKAFSPDVAQAFFSTSQWLAACGFGAVGLVTHHVERTNQDAFAWLWTNAATRDSAQIIGVCTHNAMSEALRVTTLVTFATEFTDRTSITTSNTRTGVICFPRNPLVSSIRCPGLADVDLLYRFHRARVEHERRGRTPTLDRFQNAGTRLQQEHADAFERLSRAGYYTLDAERQQYVPTLKGAYLMTYRLLWPFKQIQKYRKDRLADRTLQRLGFGGLEALEPETAELPVA